MAVCGIPNCPICTPQVPTTHWYSNGANTIPGNAPVMVNGQVIGYTTSGSVYGPTPAPDAGELKHIPTAIRGYRTWRVAYSTNSITGEQIGVLPGLYAKSVNNAEPWKPGVTIAACAGGTIYSQPAPHEAPRRNCQCGLYAWYRPGRVEPVHKATSGLFGGFAIGGLYDGDPEPEIVGVIEGAGRVLKFARGFKAEKARIIAIYAADAAQAEMIRATYPDARLFEDKTAMLEAFPPEIEEVTVKDAVNRRVGGWNVGGPVSGGLMPAGMQMLSSSASFTSTLNTKDFLETLKRSLGVPTSAEEEADDLTEETEQERALRLRQSRNTGPSVGSFRTDGKRKKGR